MRRAVDLEAVGIKACAGCFGPFADVIAIPVGATWGHSVEARVQLCAACKVGLYRPWMRRKS